MAAGDTVQNEDVYVHSSASVEDDVLMGDGTKVWADVQIRSGARIGVDCVLGRNVFVDLNVVVGNRVKVQNNASLYEGVELEDGVFVGPHVIFTNDRVPRAVTPSGRPKGTDDWVLGRIHVGEGVAIGAGVVIVTDTAIGRWAMIGSGSVVTGDVPDHALVVGNPGRVIGYVSAGGARYDSQDEARAATLVEAEEES